MSEVLRNAARELYGAYDNGAGVEKSYMAHETLDNIDSEAYGAAMDNITSVIQEAYQASENLDGHGALRIVSEAAYTAVEASGFTDTQIARIALSEISAEWIVEASPDEEQMKTMASLVMKSRPVTREFLKLFWWDDALDID